MSTMAKINCLVNGEAKNDVPLTDRGLQYGDGVFETIAFVDGQLQFWQEHMDRLQKGCRVLSIASPDLKLLRTEVSRVTDDTLDTVVKITITRGDSIRGYLPIAENKPRRIVCSLPMSDYNIENESRGIDIALCSQRVGYNISLAGIKHLNRIDQVLARLEWNNPQYCEGIMLDYDDNIISGTMSNVFVVKNNTLLLPDLSSAGIEGVIRRIIIRLAKNHGLALNITNIKLADIKQATEMFVTNSLIKIWPIKSFNGEIFASPGKVTSILIKLLKKISTER